MHRSTGCWCVRRPCPLRADLQWPWHAPQELESAVGNPPAKRRAARAWGGGGESPAFWGPEEASGVTSEDLPAPPSSSALRRARTWSDAILGACLLRRPRSPY